MTEQIVRMPKPIILIVDWSGWTGVGVCVYPFRSDQCNFPQSDIDAQLLQYLPSCLKLGSTFVHKPDRSYRFSKSSYRNGQGFRSELVDRAPWSKHLSSISFQFLLLLSCTVRPRPRTSKCSRNNTFLLPAIQSIRSIKPPSGL